jgi:cell filamentation protein
LTPQHLQAIHRYIFQDVYAWAGAFRTLNMLSIPFADGNGRAQREFIRQQAARNGCALDWSRVSHEQMTEASKTSFQRGDNFRPRKDLPDGS